MNKEHDDGAQRGIAERGESDPIADHVFPPGHHRPSITYCSASIMATNGHHPVTNWAIRPCNCGSAHSSNLEATAGGGCGAVLLGPAEGLDLQVDQDAAISANRECLRTKLSSRPGKRRTTGATVDLTISGFRPSLGFDQVIKHFATRAVGNALPRPPLGNDTHCPRWAYKATSILAQ
jgi:hypothetical protein